MEYFIGSVLTFIAVIYLSKSIRSEARKHVSLPLKYTQSRAYELIRPVIDMVLPELKKNKVTQATKHFDKSHIRIVFSATEAFWIAQNKLYKADLIEGVVDENSTQVVDTMAMDKVELDKMMFIVEKLTEGLTNDNSDSGH